METFFKIGFAGIALMQVAIFITYIVGLIHAFYQSVWLGIVCLFFAPVTVVIEVADWFTTKSLWVELGNLINGLINGV